VLKSFTRKIIYREINLYQNHMRPSSGAKRGRWVYEGSELEFDLTNPISCHSVFRHYRTRFIGIVMGYYTL